MSGRESRLSGAMGSAVGGAFSGPPLPMTMSGCPRRGHRVAGLRVVGPTADATETPVNPAGDFEPASVAWASFAVHPAASVVLVSDARPPFARPGGGARPAPGRMAVSHAEVGREVIERQGRAAPGTGPLRNIGLVAGIRPSHGWPPAVSRGEPFIPRGKLRHGLPGRRGAFRSPLGDAPEWRRGRAEPGVRDARRLSPRSSSHSSQKDAWPCWQMSSAQPGW
jgi:hypothetical protein